MLSVSVLECSLHVSRKHFIEDSNKRDVQRTGQRGHLFKLRLFVGFYWEQMAPGSARPYTASPRTDSWVIMIKERPWIIAQLPISTLHLLSHFSLCSVWLCLRLLAFLWEVRSMTFSTTYIHIFSIKLFSYTFCVFTEIGFSIDRVEFLAVPQSTMGQEVSTLSAFSGC